MDAIVVTAGELERAEENREGNPIPTLEPALCRAPSPSSRTDHKGEWPSIGQSMNLSEYF